jgi:preprotein translocase subunit SecA
MAGRGTDLVLGPGSREAGGLYVIGTERHDSRRIDNQLRGRSGRQGDPGESKFFLSLEDDLMRIFAGDRLTSIMQRLGMREGEAIVSPMVSRAIEKAQHRVEEQNFSSRKHLLEYDDVMNQQRQVIYNLRNEALHNTAGQQLDFLSETVRKMVDGIIRKNASFEKGGGFNLDGIKHDMKAELGTIVDLHDVRSDGIAEDELSSKLTEQVLKRYDSKYKDLGEENLGRLESYVFLQVIDRAWKNNLQSMDNLRDSVSLRGYGQRDPLQEYKKEAFRLFEGMMGRIFDETTQTLLFLDVSHVKQSDLHADEPDEETLVFAHPDAATSTSAQSPESAPKRPGSSASDDGMIYHGSRVSEDSTPTRPKSSPHRAKEKVGRNEPCPCGSGKKFKKCHGALEAVT